MKSYVEKASFDRLETFVNKSSAGFLHVRSCLRIFLILIFWSAGTNHSLKAQIEGLITDKKGIPLPYASVYEANTTNGTVCNEDGFYTYEPKNNGLVIIEFHYVGYQKKVVKVNYEGRPFKLNIILEEDLEMINEIIITANQEDPAYPILRKAIAKRPAHLEWIPSFEADLYVKGLIKIKDAPEIFLGNEVNNLGGILDSLRQGIIYLSESKSKYYFTLPDKSKEIMLSTKKSGSSSLFTANQFSMADINIYKNYNEMGRSVMSPLADDAFSQYRYKLLQTQVDDKGRLLYKIEVSPKSAATPLMKGVIYIVGDSWNVQSADLRLSGKALKIPLMDSIRFTQVFLPLPTGEWPLFSQTMFFEGNFFGFRIGGNFTYMFSNYETGKDIRHVFENKEVFKVNEDALNQDSTYWATYRPVPLTTEEMKDYQKKDSLQKIWTSKTYLDSMDRVSNKFGFSDVLLGYTYSNRYKNFSLHYSDPLSLLRYNVVEGWNVYVNPYYARRDSAGRNWIVQPLVVYGFSDKTWKPSLKIKRLFDPEMMGEMVLEFGKVYAQFDENNPILLRSNTWSSLFYRQNYIRLFDKAFIKFSWEKEVVNSLYIKSFVEYAYRSQLEKKSDFSFFYLDREYENNIPNPDVPADAYRAHTIARVSWELTWAPGQTYSSYPGLRIRNPGDWPRLIVQQVVGVPYRDKAKPFSTLRIRIEDNQVNLHNLGYFSYNLEWAGHLGNKPEFFQDYLHPLGNEWLMPDDGRLQMYYLLPFYEYSTDDFYVGGHWKHHFNGYIMDKIPVLKKTSLKTVLTANYLWHPTKKHYLETGLGIENIIISQIPLGSIEYFWSWGTTGLRDQGFIIKMTQILMN